MSVEHLAACLHHSRAKGTTKLVLLGIANHQGDGGAWPSVRTLARYANTSERSVQRAVLWLVANGEVTVEVQGGGGRNLEDHARPNRYQVLVACPSWCDRTTNHRDTRPQATLHLGGPGDTGVTPPGDTGVTPPGDTGVTPPGDTGVTRTVIRTNPPPTPP